MDYVSPQEVVAETSAPAKQKASLPVRDLLVRRVLGGVFLGYATLLAVVILSQGLPGRRAPSAQAT